MANIFPKWANRLPAMIILGVSLMGAAVLWGISYYATPKYTRVGYRPKQPVSFDHSIHVSQLGMDCRYCHTYVDRSEHAHVPDSSTCMNCHTQIKPDSPALAPIRDSFTSGQPVEWIRIHKTPDYVYFNHSVHVNRGISCVECHGNVDKMTEVYHAKSLSMAFCLDCHRSPEDFIRPVDKVYDLNWNWPGMNPEESRKQRLQMVEDWNVQPPQSCSGCHR